MTHISDYVSATELKRLSTTSNRKATILVSVNWLIIFFAFTLVHLYPNIFTVILAILLIGSRQLGLGVLMHEAGHGILFSTPQFNQSFGQWLCAYPILADLNAYAATHREHHRLAGTDRDPDLANYQAYPVSTASFKRKLFRDLSGQTGIKLLSGIFAGGGNRMLSTESTQQHLLGGLLINLLLAFIVISIFSPMVYLLWWIAYLTTYTLFARLRQVAEHGAVENLMDPDPRKHTRTTLPNLLERIFICPNYVNYHCEHHFIPTIPSYNLKELHELLLDRGYYRNHPTAIEVGYKNVLNRATSAA